MLCTEHEVGTTLWWLCSQSWAQPSEDLGGYGTAAIGYAVASIGHSFAAIMQPALLYYCNHCFQLTSLYCTLFDLLLFTSALLIVLAALVLRCRKALGKPFPFHLHRGAGKLLITCLAKLFKWLLRNSSLSFSLSTNSCLWHNLTGTLGAVNLVSSMQALGTSIWLV